MPVPMIFDFFIAASRSAAAPLTLLLASEQCQGKESRVPTRDSRPIGVTPPADSSRQPGDSAARELGRALLEEGRQPLTVILRLDHHPLGQPLPGQARLEVERERSVE